MQAGINTDWNFNKKNFDVITFSLVLEHIRNLDHVFSQASNSLRTGGCVYVGELHPFKQYAGSKARFETENGVQAVECFIHHISDFVSSAKRYGLIVKDVCEYFDDNDRLGIPRTSILIFKKT